MVAGCGGTQVLGWIKPGTTQDDFNTESQECRVQASTTPNSFNSCMLSKGWSKGNVLQKPKPTWGG